MSDFDNISTAPRAPSPSNESVSSSGSERIVYDQIIIQSPSIVFVAYGPLADNNPLSFKEAMSRSDHKL